jgi:MFS family permease
VSDFALLLLTRVLRAFGFGFAAVLIGLHLERHGLSAVEIGAILAAGSLAGALLGLGFARLAVHVGRRGALALAGLLMAMAGLDLAVAPSFALLLLGALTGMLGAAQPDLGPFSAVEQAVLTESVDASRRNRAFARYSLSGGLAIAAGALAAAYGSDLARSTQLFLLYALLGVATAAVPLTLSSRVEADAEPPRLADLRPLAGLASLFALDAIGGGLIPIAVISYWLHRRFGAGTDVLAPAFTAIAVLQAASYEVSGRLADRIGLVNTMVFTHLPSNLLLLTVPFASSLPVALALLLARFATSQMDVPARQAYLVSIVPASQRASAVAATGAVRGVAQAAGPALAGAAIQAAAFGLPFWLGGAMKVVYDLALYAGFRQRKAEHERRA